MFIYCVYLTVYSGNKFPLFYIGSKDIKSIKEGYKGSVNSKQYKNIFKLELKQNPELFKTFIISRHKTRIEAYEKEKSIQLKLNVIENILYINKAVAYAPIGLSNKGRSFSNEHKKKLSISHKKRYLEKGNPNLGKKRPTRSKEHSIRISMSLKGRTSPMRGKNHSEETKSKQSAAAKNRPLLECPICNKQLQKANLVRHHGLDGSKCFQKVHS